VSIFATPISNYRWPNSDGLNRALRNAVGQHGEATPGISRSNAGGWHSDTDFLDWDMDCVRELHGRIRAYVIGLCAAVAREPEDPANRSFLMEGWANVLRYGSSAESVGLWGGSM
jgi:hypothetical protein